MARLRPPWMAEVRKSQEQFFRHKNIYREPLKMHSPKIVYRKDAKDAKKISRFFRKKMTLRSLRLCGEMSLC